MGHVKACPECGKIVEWTRGEPRTVTTVSGKVIEGVVPLSLVCPEHGPFDNVKAKMEDAWKRVERGMRKSE